MSPAELRAAARAMYEARAAELALRPWVSGGWREGAPSPKQRTAITRAAASPLAQLSEAEREVVRAVAIRPDAAGVGAVSDCLAVALGRLDSARAAAAPTQTPAAPVAPVAAPVVPVGGGEAERRLALMAALLVAPGDRLDAVALALGGVA